MKKRIRHIALLLLMLCLPAAVMAQDPHFTQAARIPTWYNPAAAGQGVEHIRLSMLYRNQWSSVMSPFKTEGIFFDKQVSKVGFGALAVNNSSGDAGIRQFFLSGQISYRLMLHKHTIATGAQIGFVQKSFDPSKMTFDDQYSVDQGYNPANPTAESFSYTSLTRPDFGLGALWTWGDQDKSRFYPHAGLSLQHVNQPKESFIEQDNIIPRKFTAQAGVGIRIREWWFITPALQYSRQQFARELQTSIMFRWPLEDYKQFESGLILRNRDAIALYAGYQLNSFMMGMSYDVNVSGATGGPGAVEISLTYIPRARLKKEEAKKKSKTPPKIEREAQDRPLKGPVSEFRNKSTANPVGRPATTKKTTTVPGKNAGEGTVTVMPKFRVIGPVRRAVKVPAKPGAITTKPGAVVPAPSTAKVLAPTAKNIAVLNPALIRENTVPAVRLAMSGIAVNLSPAEPVRLPADSVSGRSPLIIPDPVVVPVHPVTEKIIPVARKTTYFIDVAEKIPVEPVRLPADFTTHVKPVMIPDIDESPVLILMDSVAPIERIRTTAFELPETNPIVPVHSLDEIATSITPVMIPDIDESPVLILMDSLAPIDRITTTVVETPVMNEPELLRAPNDSVRALNPVMIPDIDESPVLMTMDSVALIEPVTTTTVDVQVTNMPASAIVTDADNDGIADKDDQCPYMKGSLATGGCPDTDGDGITDMNDQCPMVKGSSTAGGCPAGALLEFETTVTMHRGNIEFKTGSTEVHGIYKLDIIEPVLDSLYEHPEMVLVITGHTDNEGDAYFNMQLSQARADVVKAIFMRKGLEEDRIQTVAYGENMPMRDNQTETGRQRNRRVEIHVLRKK